MERKNLDLEEDLFYAMSEGNPGALTVITKLMEKNGIGGALMLLSLDEMNIRGSQIWVAYKDYCKEFLDLFEKSVANKDEQMIKAINIETAKMGGGYKAVTDVRKLDPEEEILSEEEIKTLQKETKPVHKEAQERLAQTF